MHPTVPAPSGKSPRSAVVHLGRKKWVLEPGRSVSFGRGSPCDIRVAHDPLDEHVSRRAGVLEHLGEDVVVRNESATRILIFRPARGQAKIIQPGETITCRPHREFLLGVSGRGGNHYVLQVTSDF
ncbi:MAG: hypothetical protein QG622_2149 [Actinomycetota bacterium]|nr:hypothetical protein [Actinomycetota bacterium]